MNRRPVVGYEGLYEVSDEGEVCSMTMNLRGPMSLVENEKGYLRIMLRKSGVVKNHRVHRLVAMAFIDNPCNLQEVHHIDGNKKNNRLENLEWCDGKENLGKSDYHEGLKKR